MRLMRCDCIALGVTGGLSACKLLLASLAPICLATMRETHNGHDESVIFDGIDYAIRALSNPIFLGT